MNWEFRLIYPGILEYRNANEAVLLNIAKHFALDKIKKCLYHLVWG